MSDRTRPNVFSAPGQWYRANLHTHTTESDGAWTPPAVLEWHRQHGYQAVALTDHDRVTESRLSLEAGPNAMLSLPGVELSLGRSRQASPIHVVAVGLTRPLADSPRDLPDALDWVWEQGAFGYLAHPYWSGLSHEDLADLASLRSIEIFNTGADWENRKGEACNYWDDLLGRGRRVSGLATDDSHWRDPDAGGGWAMIRAAEFSGPALVDALRQGLFFSSSGPLIEAIVWEGPRLWIRSSPVESLTWIGAGRLGWSRHAAPGAVLTEAEFRLRGNPDWIRVEVRDPQGRRAWSNPLYAGD